MGFHRVTFHDRLKIMIVVLGMLGLFIMRHWHLDGKTQLGFNFFANGKLQIGLSVFVCKAVLYLWQNPMRFLILQ